MLERSEYVAHHLRGDERRAGVAQMLAAARSPVTPGDPLPTEVRYELRRLDSPATLVTGVAYDGLRLMEAMCAVGGAGVPGAEALHVAFTQRLPVTVDPDDGRTHARVILMGPMALISTTGVVMAPARSAKWHAARRLEAGLGITGAAMTVPGAAAGAPGVTSLPPFLTYDDPRMTCVMKGYVLQALFHRVSGDPFCDDPDCRLFDAHTQAGLLRAQQGEPGLCQRHLGMLRDIRAGATAAGRV